MPYRSAIESNKCNKRTAVRKVATLLWKLTCHKGSHSVTCHPAEVTFPPLPQPKLVLESATPEGCKAELTYAMTCATVMQARLQSKSNRSLATRVGLGGGLSRRGWTYASGINGCRWLSADDMLLVVDREIRAMAKNRSNTDASRLRAKNRFGGKSAVAPDIVI